MRFVDAEALQAAIPVPELLDAVEDAYRAVAAGQDRSPIRTHVSIPGGDLLLMPGVLEGAAGSTVKIVTIVPGNADRDLPTLHAVVVVLERGTARPLAILDGATLTAMRTGAASGVATRLLARPDAAVLALVGAGGQASWQARAVLAARPIREVRVYARRADRRAAFVRWLGEELGQRVTVRDSPDAESAVRGADVVCCATTSSQPVLEAAWVDEGAHVNGIGAFRLDMVELPPALFGRAARVTVDSVAAAHAEAGDLVAALQAGELEDRAVIEIGTVDRGWAGSRDARAITVFKSVGLAAQDVAAASVALRHLHPD